MKRRFLGISLLLAALLSIGWWLLKLMRPPVTALKKTVETPAYIGQQLTVRRYGENGELEQKLVTPRMAYYESSGISELTHPILWRYNPEMPPWRMQASKAIIYNDDNTVFMPGEVVMDRRADTNHPPYHLVTRDLTYRTTDAYASTDQNVRIESDQQWITAIGMRGWLKQPVKIHLLQQVRGYYVFD